MRAVAAEMTDKLQQLWLRQLTREFADICFQYRLDLRPPVFELSGGVKQLGCWLPARRTIRISRHLIEDHPWNVVLMVLKHEMAHQVCSELYGCRRTGHDRDFKRACRLLGVTPPYNRSSGDLAAVVADPPQEMQTTAGRKIIARISKLLALAGSDNEHEAALAMQRATQLLHRHNLEQAAVDNLSSCRRVIIDTRSKQIPAYRRSICAILRDYFFVQVICSSLYDPQSNCSFKTIELLGRMENVPVAEHCYHFLEQQLASLWQTNRHAFKGNSRTARNSYYLGLLHGFAEKMATRTGSCCPTRAKDHVAATAGSLAVCRDSTLQDFVSFHFPRLKKHSSRGLKIYSQPFEEAVDVGRKMILHQSVEERKKGLQGLLERG